MFNDEDLLVSIRFCLCMKALIKKERQLKSKTFNRLGITASRSYLFNYDRPGLGRVTKTVPARRKAIL